MNLIKCIDCGKEYSPRINACPNCGCPTIETLNEICKNDKCVIICHEAYDISEILSNIENGVDDQVNIDAIAKSVEISTSAAYCILQEIKKGNFLPWTENSYGTLTNPKYQEKINQRNEQIQPAQHVPFCPSCGSTNIEKISMTKKTVGFLAVGILSSNVRKQFRCKNCGYKW